MSNREEARRQTQDYNIHVLSLTDRDALQPCCYQMIIAVFKSDWQRCGLQVPLFRHQMGF